MQKIMGCIRAAAQKYSLIEDGDKIAVGVSGGKDSLVLLYALSKLREYHDKKFEVYAIFADPCFDGKETDFSEIEALCKALNTQCIIRRTQLAKIIFEDRKEKNPCSLCARMRRGILHNMCIENDCNKLALGHHMDDAVNTFFMNLFYSGEIGCFSPKTYLSRKDITLIRPMIFCEEKDITKAAKRLSLPVIKSLCPADGNTGRAATGSFVSDMEKEIPDLKSKVIGAMQRGCIDGWDVLV